MTAQNAKLVLLSCSGETDAHPAAHMLLPEEHRWWGFRGPSESCVVRLVPPSSIFGLSIVNAGSKTLEVQACSSPPDGEPPTDPGAWQTLAKAVMRTDAEVLAGKARARRRAYVAAAHPSDTPLKLPQAASVATWTHLRVMCTAGEGEEGPTTSSEPALAGVTSLGVSTTPPAPPSQSCPTPGLPHLNAEAAAPARASGDGKREGQQQQSGPGQSGVGMSPRPHCPPLDEAAAKRQRTSAPHNQKDTLHLARVTKPPPSAESPPAPPAPRPVAAASAPGSQQPSAARGGGAGGAEHEWSGGGTSSDSGTARGGAHKAGSSSNTSTGGGSGKHAAPGHLKPSRSGGAGRPMGGSSARPSDPPPASSKTPPTARKKCAPPLEGVRVAISGILNPERARLRDVATGLGASYAPDWGAGCTHLVCAFPNTPKHAQAVRAGGLVVSAAWVDACAAAGRRRGEGGFRV